MSEKKAMTIDLEPTWMGILHLVAIGALPESELYPAIQIADFVRQAQKQGYSQVIITLNKRNVTMETK